MTREAMCSLDGLPVVVENKKQGLAVALHKTIYEEGEELKVETSFYISFLDGVNSFEWVNAQLVRPMNAQEMRQLMNGNGLVVPR